MAGQDELLGLGGREATDEMSALVERRKPRRRTDLQICISLVGMWCIGLPQQLTTPSSFELSSLPSISGLARDWPALARPGSPALPPAGSSSHCSPVGRTPSPARARRKLAGPSSEIDEDRSKPGHLMWHGTQAGDCVARKLPGPRREGAMAVGGMQRERTARATAPKACACIANRGARSAPSCAGRRPRLNWSPATGASGWKLSNQSQTCVSLLAGTSKSYFSAKGCPCSCDRAPRAWPAGKARTPGRRARARACLSDWLPNARLRALCFLSSPTMPVANIHSLPPELLHEILQYASPQTHPACHDRPGLSRACLVHSRWRPVAQALMTQSLSFHHSNLEQLRSFVKHGPRGFRCRRLRFGGTAEDLVGLVGRAQEGGVQALVLEAGLSEGLFGLEGLRGM